MPKTLTPDQTFPEVTVLILTDGQVTVNPIVAVATGN